jgi:hypothetical protein
VPDLGISKAAARAILKATKKGAKEAVVVRPGQQVKPDVPAQPVETVDDVITAQPDVPAQPVETVDDVITAQRLSQAILKATKKDAKEAVVVRPGQQVKPDVPAQPVETVDDVITAQRLSQAKLKDFDLDEPFQPNYDTFRTTDDVNAVIADRAQQIAPQIDQARRGIITHQQLRAFADDLDVNKEVVDAFVNRNPGSLDSIKPETVIAARHLLENSATTVKTLADKIVAGVGTDLDRIRFRRQFQLHKEFLDELFTGFMGVRAESGRLLNAFGVPLEGDFGGLKRVRELVETANGHDLDSLVSAVAMMDEGNVGGISNLTRKYTQSKFMGTINELFIQSILSGIKTLLVNINGNFLMQSMNIAEPALAARIGRFLGPGEHVQVGEASARLHGTLTAWKDGFRIFAQSMRTGVALDDVVKFEGTRRRSVSAEHLMSAQMRATPIGRFLEAALDGFRLGVPVKLGGKGLIKQIGTNVPPGKTVRESVKAHGFPIPGLGQIVRESTERRMVPFDEFFKTLAYRGEMERLAFLHAHDQVSNGLIKASEAADVARRFMEDSTNLTAVRLAEDYARYVTFQNELGPAGKKLQLFLRSVPVLSLIAPFVRTPINLFTAGIGDRSLVTLFRPKFWSTMKAGGRERDMMLARVTMGTATSAVIASYVIDGTITGAGPTNPEARALMELQGWQPYSIRVGDKYHSYARAEPMAFIIGATADTVEILSYLNSDVEGLDDEIQQANNAAAAIIIGVTNNTMSKLFFKGMADFTEMMSDPTRYFQGWIRNFVVSMVPESALRAQLGQIDDPYLREAWTVLDALRNKSGIPGWSEESPPRRDIFGNPRPVSAGSLLGPMSPFPSRDINNDFVVDELVSLMEQTRDVPVTMPAKRIEGMRLSVDEYDLLIFLSRTRRAKNGMVFKDALQQLMGQPAYALATPDMRVELIKQKQKLYDDDARMELEKQNILLAERMREYRQKRSQLRFGE